MAAGKAYAEYIKAALNTSYILVFSGVTPSTHQKALGKAGVKQGFFADGLLSRPGLYDTVQELNDYRENRHHNPPSNGKADTTVSNRLIIQPVVYSNKQHK